MSTQIALKNPSILNDLPSGVALDILLPIEATLKLVLPIIQKQASSMPEMVSAYQDWLMERETNLSVRQAFWMWENYAEQFMRELPKRLNQWIVQPRLRKNPIELAKEQYEAWMKLNYRAWKERQQVTRLGKLKVTALEVFAKVVVFLVCVPLFAALYSGLANFR